MVVLKVFGILFLSVGIISAEKALCKRSIAHLNTKIQNQLKNVESYRFPFHSLLIPWISTLKDNINNGALCGESSTHTYDSLYSAASYLASSEDTPVFCNLCMTILTDIYKAATKLSNFNPIIREILQEIPKPSYYCSQMLPSCKNVLLDTSVKYQENLENESPVKCVECTVCRTFLKFLQFQAFSNQENVKKFEDALRTDLCDNLFHNRTDLANTCKEMAHDIASGFFDTLHVVFNPDAYCSRKRKDIGADYCTAEIIIQLENEPLQCVKEACEKLPIILQFICNNLP